MPPIRTESSRNSLQREGNILLAIKAIKNDEFSSIRQAARCFNVPESTLRTRLNGTIFRADVRANSHKLTENEEISLEKWILDMDARGAAPRPSMVADMANLLLAKRGETPIQTVGVNWTTTFVKRHPNLSSRYSKRYNYERAKNEDPKIIQAWFDLVQRTILQYGITPSDIYNFDETGFAMGQTSSAKVITRADYYGKRGLLQPGNREWVTVIECISAAGYALPPYIIFKHKSLNLGWAEGLPQNWMLENSPNGWTSDEISLHWLQKVLIPDISRSQGGYRLLVLDGHGSHLTPQFDEICAANNIIPICMPPHSSHLLQPLDVGCFAVLKRAYSQLVESKTRLGVNHIDKLDFLMAYPSARADTFKLKTIQNSFRATGLSPYSPTEVLLKLNIHLKTPTPPGSVGSIFSPKTPQNLSQLQKQASSIKALIKKRSQSPPTPTDRALNQLIKGCELAMNSATFLAHENSALRAENEKKKQKRRRTTRWIENPGGISVGDALQALQNPPEVVNPAIPPSVEAAAAPLQPRTRAPRGCGICRVPGHRRETCPDRPK
jgi:hypothetical protein